MMAKLSEISFMLKQLAGAYNQEVTAEQAKAYHSILQRYPRMVLVTACSKLMEKSTWFPRISEIVKAADRETLSYRQPDGTELDEAMFWYLYTHNLSSTDELTDEDMQQIRRDAGMAQQQPARRVKELTRGEIRAMSQAQGLPVAQRFRETV